jgi:Uma2 family endonuclease
MGHPEYPPFVSRPPYVVDPEDPRAPPQDVWDAMSAEERIRVVEELPSEIESAYPPEGDVHRKAKDGPLGALGAYFKRIGRRVYLSSNLPVYYPGERIFAPDLIAVLDVEPHERDRWVTSHEARGLDLALEVLYRGDDRKDLERNVERFARLGIPEYFIYDRKRGRLQGYVLEEGEAVYERIVPQQGRWPSRVLGLSLSLEGDRLRLYAGTAAVPELEELAARGEQLLADAIARVEEAEKRAEQETERAEQAAQRAEQEARRAEQEAERANRAERELAALRAELAGRRG